ncbi:MAG: terminase small subunit [Clostridium sp.]|nr:terminase small subunit [Clostridium sp.]
MSKNKVGQPLKFESPEELQERIEEYFIWAKKNKRHITITDLAYYLGTNRTTLLNYENSMENDWLKSVDDDVKVRYVNTIKRAKARIDIFTLKNNYNWVDKQEIEQTNKTIEVSLED